MVESERAICSLAFDGIRNLPRPPFFLPAFDAVALAAAAGLYLVCAMGSREGVR